MVGLAAYDASKGGVVMFTRSLALGLARHGIAVNAIARGAIATPGRHDAARAEQQGLGAEQTEAMQGAMVECIPLVRWGEPDDIATMAVFLASAAARYMTGATVLVDGGMLLA